MTQKQKIVEIELEELELTQSYEKKIAQIFLSIVGREDIQAVEDCLKKMELSDERKKMIIDILNELIKDSVSQPNELIKDNVSQPNELIKDSVSQPNELIKDNVSQPNELIKDSVSQPVNTSNIFPAKSSVLAKQSFFPAEKRTKLSVFFNKASGYIFEKTVTFPEDCMKLLSRMAGV